MRSIGVLENGGLKPPMPPGLRAFSARMKRSAIGADRRWLNRQGLLWSLHSCLALVQQDLRFQCESSQGLGMLQCGRALLVGGSRVTELLARLGFSKEFLDP